MSPREIQHGIAQRVHELRTIARRTYQVDIRPTVKYTTRGRTAGYAIFDANVLDFNIELAVRNRAEFVQQIVGHEFCHLVANEVYGHTGHGSEWKEVMSEFDLKPERCHTLDTSEVVRQPKTFPYACSCNTYTFNKLTHHKLQHGLFQCNECRGLVKFVGHAKDVRQFQAGTRENRIATALQQYKRDQLPMTDQLILLMDFFNLSFGTAKTYYYQFRPI